MKTLFTFTFLLSGLIAEAQRPAVDRIETTNGALTIQPVFHGALVLKWNNKTIYVDPYGGSKGFKELPPPDLILITDIHPDHLDTATLNHLPTNKAIFVMPQAVADKLPDTFQNRRVVLANGISTNELGISISAIPMYNLPEAADAKHPKGRGNGYILNMGGKSIYISGDTEDIPEMRQLKNIDIAFICMNLPFTMGIEQAASAVLEFKSAVVYPYHYRGKDGFSDTKAFKKMVNAGNSKIEVRLREWYSQ